MKNSTKKKCLLLYKTPSHRKALIIIDVFLKKLKYKVNICLIDDLRDFKNLLKYDFLFLSLGGKNINIIINYIRKFKDKPFSIALFPGIVTEEQFDAYITRLRCDLVLLNSNSNTNFYRKICKLFNRKYNGILFGATWFNDENISKYVEKKRNVVFFEQIDIPFSISERNDLVSKLIYFANKNKNINLLIKPRVEFMDNDKSIVSLIKKFKIPNNMMINNNNINTLIQNMEFGLTVSSSVVIEVILRNKKIIIINDYDKHEYFSYFYQSAFISKSLLDIDINNIPIANNLWIKNNITNPYDNFDKLEKKINNCEYNSYVFDKQVFFIKIKLMIHFFFKHIKNFRKIMRNSNNAIKMIKEKNE